MTDPRFLLAWDARIPLRRRNALPAWPQFYDSRPIQEKENLPKSVATPVANFFMLFGIHEVMGQCLSDLSDNEERMFL